MPRAESQVQTTAQAKPCPFCGAQPIMKAWHGAKWMLDCGNDECDASPSTHGQTRQVALARWNTRVA